MIPAFLASWVASLALGRFKAIFMAGGTMLVVGLIAGFSFGLRLAAWEGQRETIAAYQQQIDTLKGRIAEHELEAITQRRLAEVAAASDAAARKEIVELQDRIDASPVAADCTLPPARVRELRQVTAATRRTVAPASARRPDGRPAPATVSGGWEPKVTRQVGGVSGGG